MEYNYSRQPVMGYQGGGEVPLDRAGAWFKFASDLGRTNRAAKAAWDEEQKKQEKHGFWNNFWGTALELGIPALLPGVGNIFGWGGGRVFDWLTKDSLGKAITSLGSKVLGKSIHAGSYKPGEYVSPTAFGKQSFDDITASGEDYKSASKARAASEFLTDLAISRLPHPVTGDPIGSFSQQLGVSPLEFGGHSNIPVGKEWVKRFPVPNVTSSSATGALQRHGVPLTMPTQRPPLGTTPFTGSLGQLPTSVGPSLADYLKEADAGRWKQARHMSGFQQVPFEIQLQQL